MALSNGIEIYETHCPEDHGDIKHKFFTLPLTELSELSSHLPEGVNPELYCLSVRNLQSPTCDSAERYFLENLFIKGKGIDDEAKTETELFYFYIVGIGGTKQKIAFPYPVTIFRKFEFEETGLITDSRAGLFDNWIVSEEEHNQWVIQRPLDRVVFETILKNQTLLNESEKNFNLRDPLALRSQYLSEIAESIGIIDLT